MALAAPFAGAQMRIQLMGRVVDADNGPIAGAQVWLRTAGVTATTNAQGIFQMTATTTVFPGLSSESVPSMGRGLLRFRLSAPGRTVRITALDFLGKETGSVRLENLSAGNQILPLAGLFPGSAGSFAACRLLRLETPEGTSLLRPDDDQGVSALALTSRELKAPASLAKTVATYVDTVEVAKEGFVAGTRRIRTYVDTLSDITLRPDSKASTLAPANPGGGALPVVNIAPFTPPGRVSQPGLPTWANAGFLRGRPLPDLSAAKVLDGRALGIVPDDGKDDSEALQKAIDGAKADAANSFSRPTVIALPSGTIHITRQIWLSTNYVVIRGQGNDPADPKSTRIVFRPIEARFDIVTPDGSLPDLDRMQHDGKTMRWTWPGRGAFRVQVRDVHSKVAASHKSAPANRKEIFEGSVNFHWMSGLDVDQSQPLAARAGERTIRLGKSLSTSALGQLKPGTPIWVGAANSQKVYLEQGVTYKPYWENGHMKSQLFYIASADLARRTVTLDEPLEFDVPANNTSDGSPAILGKTYESVVVPMRLIQGVGFENFYFTQEMDGMPKVGGGVYTYKPADARNNYGNMAPEYALHGIVFKWAANCWVRDVRMFMTGSHPIVTEQAKNLQFVRNHLDGSWNKGKGGHGYFRLSRSWGSLVYANTLRNLRHLTLQWSASRNVVVGNDVDCDINLHGGWERYNLIENNVAAVSFGHAPGNCKSNCGDEAGDNTDRSQWYPIWWGAGAKSGKWSGSSGPRNIYYNNRMSKQLKEGGPFEPYLPYDAGAGTGPKTVFQLGWDRQTPEGSRWEHLTVGGAMLPDWARHETMDFSKAPNTGVNAARTSDAPSLFATGEYLQELRGR